MRSATKMSSEVTFAITKLCFQCLEHQQNMTSWGCPFFMPQVPLC